MEHSFWRERWNEGRIGFHEGKPNDLLERHADQLRGRVLVPLCGKAEDLAFLAARGHEVIGVELVESAVRAFFAEHSVVPTEGKAGPLKRFSAANITLYAGDFFACTPELVGPVDTFYDRAAIVALPPELRARYVPHLRSLVNPGGRGLVITFEYPQPLMEGPPFSVAEDELRRHYAGARVDLLEDASAQLPRLTGSRGLAKERCFLIEL
jgi:thiopurine S-methyltransferase